MLLAKIKDKLFNRRNKIEIDDVEVKGDIPASIKSLIQSIASEIDGTSLKMGAYILNEDNAKFIWVEEVPEDYSGNFYSFFDDGLYVTNYSEGETINEAVLGSNGLVIYDNDGSTITFDVNGANKLNFPRLTHSFNELDATLKQIVEDAILDNATDGVACTQAQWDAIKALLDKSLYLNYDGYSMIKASSNGITQYVFGLRMIDAGTSLMFDYDEPNLILYASLDQA